MMMTMGAMPPAPQMMPSMTGRQMPGAMPGAMPGMMLGSMPGMMPGSMPGMMPGSMPGMMPGMMPGSMPGMMPGMMPGSLPGAMPGMMPGMMPGSMPYMAPGMPMPTMGQEQNIAEAMKQFDQGRQEQARELVGDGQSMLHPMPEGIKEMQLVRAPRPDPLTGHSVMATGVIHRCHPEDYTCTIQFLPDQHRLRVAVPSLEPITNITPTYPKVLLRHGERPPSVKEQDEYFHREQAMRHRGLDPRLYCCFCEAHFPAGLSHRCPSCGNRRLDDQPLREGEEDHYKRAPNDVMDRWGIPAGTMEALRNRSIPAYQVTGEYGEHFYSALYRNNFYYQKANQEKKVMPPANAGKWGDFALHADDKPKPKAKPRGILSKLPPAPEEGDAELTHGVLANHVVDPSTTEGMMPDGRCVVTHKYVALDGQEYEQDISSGAWYPIYDDRP
eukprot:TRINITY_DN17558_c0_g1_i1.p1 TRINITY_DN17558_c0_g1~~TRINITY_DN17558_c0_g1_i1.p1  ORF type:complete len:442 (+),score=57.75 TRINITY_DN17558_c0_g1_i1:122-1447(+)